MMEELEVAVKAALDAGAAILEIYAQDFDVEYKEDESPLTSADKASHAIIMNALSATAYPVLSEESAAIDYENRRGWEKYWLVDPIDGTKEFIKKNGEFTVNIALIENAVPVGGVVYVPVMDTLYVGSPEGAWKIEAAAGKDAFELIAAAEEISVSGKPDGALKVVASKSHCNDETIKFIEELEEEYGAAERVSRGSSLKLCMVAEGAADIYPRIAPTMEWDTAAAHAVVSAAGGRVFQFTDSVTASAFKTASTHIPDVVYNKGDLLNPYFVVSGLHE
ncbi:MAG: 3'(2'),5'-bisphosphate nucleotidase CysQ [Pontiella sp.]|nr:3'(2'),5'-bisphosphate nucleotidase CysQ [Pontiella sp.]